jgi:magnesium transporter
MLEGVIELSDILACRDDSVVISDIMETNVIKAVTTEHRETAADLFSKYDLHTLPVVDNENRLVGIVTADDILDVIEEEATKDIEQMAAIVPMEDEYLRTGVFTIVKKRIVWLFVLMITGVLTGSILGSFEATIATVPVLVTFMPMILNTGGNSGSQASITVIRGLTTGELEAKHVWRILWKEFRVALTVGILFAAVNFGMVYLLAGDVSGRVLIALVVSLAMLFTIILAKCIGCVLPILASKLRLDPTVMATPLITTCVDVCAMLVYFSLAVNLLSSLL